MRFLQCVYAVALIAFVVKFFEFAAKGDWLNAGVALIGAAASAHLARD